MSARHRVTALLSRRRFGLLLGLGGATLTWPFPLHAASARTELSPALRQWLNEALPRKDSAYDPFAKMLVAAAEVGAGEPTTARSGDVHPTQASLFYAAALLDTGERWRLERAREILQAVLTLQDQDADSETYGHWPWCLEEPLTKASRVQHSGAACSAALLMAWVTNRSQLGALETRVREAIVHAARSMQRQELDPARTHRAILTTGVALVAAQEFKITELRADAKARLRRLYDHVVQTGSFAEYNSPIDTLLALQELSRTLYLIRDARDKTLLTALSDLAWKHVATHFHPPTQQWAGPHSRTQETELARQPAALAFLQKACGDHVRFRGVNPIALSLDAYRLPLQFPRKWSRSFASLDAPRQIVERFVPANPTVAGARNPIIGTTWLHPRIALGSVNRGDLGAQRRPLVAYWGTPDAPRFLRLRFLKNDADCFSALLFSVQHQNHILSAVVLATDQGPPGPASNLSPGPSLRARRLQLSFDFGGSLGQCTIRPAGEQNNAVLVQDEQTRLILQPVADAFGPGRFQWEPPTLRLVRPIQAIAHDGDEQTFDWHTFGEAFVCFTLSAWTEHNKPTPPVLIERTAGHLRARWTVAGKTLELHVPTKPAPFVELNDQFRGVIV